MTRDEVSQFREEFREQHIPSWYSGTIHVVFNCIMMVGVCIYMLTLVENPTPLELLTLPVGLLIGNLGVYLIHKYLLHRVQPFVEAFTFRVHTTWHHHFYTDENFLHDTRKDFYILFFPPTVILMFILLMMPATYYLLVACSVPLNVVFLYLFTFALYFLLYESVHFISHLPLGNPLLRFPLFGFMRKHHLAHHNVELMYQYNFNVVFPLFDYILGTVYKEEPSEP